MLKRIRREKFTEVFKTHLGHKFYGEFGDPNGAPRPRKEVQNLPHRTLVTSHNAIVAPGELVSWGNRAHYLMVAQHTLTNVKRFLAVETNKTVCWARSQEVIDPVSRVAKDIGLQTIDEALPVVVEPQRELEEQNFREAQYRVFTHADIIKGDFLDDWKVLHSYDLMGVRVLEVA